MSEAKLEIYDGIVVPASALRREQQRTRYGTLADLPDEELADPEELERVMHKDMWGPILRLPQQRWECPIRPNMDEDGRVDWGAFGSVDFESYRLERDGYWYMSQQFKERLKDIVMTCEMISERIPGRAKYKVLKLVRKGILDTDDIEHWDMWQLAVNYLQALRLRERIQRLLAKSQQEREKKAAEFWAAKGG